MFVYLGIHWIFKGLWRSTLYWANSKFHISWHS